MLQPWCRFSMENQFWNILGAACSKPRRGQTAASCSTVLGRSGPCMVQPLDDVTEAGRGKNVEKDRGEGI